MTSNGPTMHEGSTHPFGAPRPEDSPLHRLATHTWKTIVGLGVLGLVVGVVGLVWPLQTTVVLGVLFGIYLVLRGLFGLAVGVIAPMFGWARAALIISSVLSFVLGLLCFRSEFQSVLLLGIWIGVSFLMNSFSALISGSAGIGPARGWAILSAVLGIIAGMILLASPIESVTTLVWVAGAFLVVIGLVEIVRGFMLRRALRQV